MGPQDRVKSTKQAGQQEGTLRGQGVWPPVRMPNGLRGAALSYRTGAGVRVCDSLTHGHVGSRAKEALLASHKSLQSPGGAIGKPRSDTPQKGERADRVRPCQDGSS